MGKESTDRRGDSPASRWHPPAPSQPFLSAQSSAAAAPTPVHNPQPHYRAPFSGYRPPFGPPNSLGISLGTSARCSPPYRAEPDPGSAAPPEAQGRSARPRPAARAPRPAVAMTNRCFRCAPTSELSGERGSRPHAPPRRSKQVRDCALGVIAETGLARYAVTHLRLGEGVSRSALRDPASSKENEEALS